MWIPLHSVLYVTLVAIVFHSSLLWWFQINIKLSCARQYRFYLIPGWSVTWLTRWSLMLCTVLNELQNLSFVSANDKLTIITIIIIHNMRQSSFKAVNIEINVMQNYLWPINNTRVQVGKVLFPNVNLYSVIDCKLTSKNIGPLMGNIEPVLVDLSLYFKGWHK